MSKEVYVAYGKNGEESYMLDNKDYGLFADYLNGCKTGR